VNLKFFGRFIGL